ncbi:extracellular solute-binding protein [Paenibacillus silvisoli]|uniref:extracellular solute-binding protein n=1 Tax=Paenibacillus silvisoli TaxID=3110539 RepID=UPI00280618D5|nr:extracellular solute-binding protein [Paenibacillus silvisoli]
MKKSRIWMGLLTSTLLLATAACSGSNNTNSPNTPAAEEQNGETNGNASGNAGAGTNTEAEAAPDLSPITYSMGTDQNKITWDTPITKKLTEKTGVSLKYDVIVGDLFQKWDIWLASGDYPDIIRLDALHLQKYVEAGAVIPLEELIEKYGPHIKEKFGDKFDLLKDKDGHIYSIFSVNAATEAPANSKPPFIVQQAVLEEAGYPEVKTLDQLYQLIKDYKAKHPQIDGNDTIGFAAAMESFMIKIGFNNPVISAQGLPDHGNFYLDGDKVNWNPVSDASKKYFQFLNKLVQEGLFDIEAFSMDLPAMQTKLAQGRVLAAYAPGWVSDQPDAALRAEGKEDRMYAHLPILFDSSMEDHSTAVTPVNSGTHQWAVSVNAKNPERIIQFIDYLFTDEGQILTQWGIEGVHYDVVDGKRVVKDEWLAKKAADADSLYKEGFTGEGTGGASQWFSIGNGAKLADGDYATPLTKELVRKEYTEKTKEVLSKYNAETWSDLLPPAQTVPGYVWQLQPPEDTLAIDVKLEENWRKSMPKMLLAKNNDEFEKEWEAFVAGSKDAGLDDYNAAFTKIWQEFVNK